MSTRARGGATAKAPDAPSATAALKAIANQVFFFYEKTDSPTAANDTAHHKFSGGLKNGSKADEHKSSVIAATLSPALQEFLKSHNSVRRGNLYVPGRVALLDPQVAITPVYSCGRRSSALR